MFLKLMIVGYPIFRQTHSEVLAGQLQDIAGLKRSISTRSFVILCSSIDFAHSIPVFFLFINPHFQPKRLRQNHTNQSKIKPLFKQVRFPCPFRICQFVLPIPNFTSWIPTGNLLHSYCFNGPFSSFIYPKKIAYGDFPQFSHSFL